jgi:hypothetical protein
VYLLLKYVNKIPTGKGLILNRKENGYRRKFLRGTSLMRDFVCRPTYLGSGYIPKTPYPILFL